MDIPTIKYIVTKDVNFITVIFRGKALIVMSFDVIDFRSLS